MTKRKKSKARRKTKRGLGCGPGPVSGDCRFNRPLEGLRGLRGRGPIISLRGRGFGRSLRSGLRGTQPEHAQRAEDMLILVERNLRHGIRDKHDCGLALDTLSLAGQARAEARWAGGQVQSDALKSEQLARRAVLDTCGCKKK